VNVKKREKGVVFCFCFLEGGVGNDEEKKMNKYS